MADTDTQVLAADPDHTTQLAAYLNAAMSRSAVARDAYEAIYGAPWSALGCGAELHDGASASAVTAL